jgi:hypothetical protein
MDRKPILKLCMCIALILLVGVATSAWSQAAASGDKGMADKKMSKAGAMCGGIAGLKCPEGQACRYPTNKCNVADLSGTCVAVKNPCPTGGAKVCGCDGKTYANQCELLTAGVREASKGACKAAMK